MLLDVYQIYGVIYKNYAKVDLDLDGV